MSGPCQDDRATVALAFANTSVEGYSDDGAGADALEAWLVGQRLVGADVEVTHTELARFLRLRIAIRAVLDARIDRRAPEDSAVRIVESAALAAPGTTIGVWAADGSVSRGWRSTLAADLVDLVCDHGERLGRDGDGGTGFVLAAAG
jgi:hypothetical protein